MLSIGWTRLADTFVNPFELLIPAGTLVVALTFPQLRLAFDIGKRTRHDCVNLDVLDGGLGSSYPI